MQALQASSKLWKLQLDDHAHGMIDITAIYTLYKLQYYILLILNWIIMLKVNKIKPALL